MWEMVLKKKRMCQSAVLQNIYHQLVLVKSCSWVVCCWLNIMGKWVFSWQLTKWLLEQKEIHRLINSENSVSGSPSGKWATTRRYSSYHNDWSSHIIFLTLVTLTWRLSVIFPQAPEHLWFQSCLMNWTRAMSWHRWTKSVYYPSRWERTWGMWHFLHLPERRQQQQQQQPVFQPTSACVWVTDTSAATDR